MAGDGVQATDLKRMGRGKSQNYTSQRWQNNINIAEKKDEYMAKGYKLSIESRR